MNKKILASMLVIGILALAMGYGTYSYFSSTKMSTGNTFTAGTLVLKLSNDYVYWHEGVTATWASPSGWAPGQSFTNTLYLKNEGSVAAQVVYEDWTDGSDPDGLLNWIQVTEISDSIPWGGYGAYETNYVVNFITPAIDLNSDGKLSLYELASWGDRKTTSASPHPWDITTSAGEDPASPPATLPAGGTLGLRFTFKLMEETEMQGKTCTIDLNVMASQNVLPGLP
jgi:predicted ribosomally synthesized peptide with SipW-like signal peptide